MNRDEILKELRILRSNTRGLAARAVLNYLMTELEEYDSISEEDIHRLFSNALLLIRIEEEDISRVKELIMRLAE
ncbi:MAG: hypothetical protein TU36_004345 [Vulcanisaeta sp. AZ3]|jgi:hypothetical protein|nr:MAG: hypothetical protein TU36_00530 [Vulcanisaeta sp. AZ3]